MPLHMNMLGLSKQIFRILAFGYIYIWQRWATHDKHYLADYIANRNGLLLLYEVWLFYETTTCWLTDGPETWDLISETWDLKLRPPVISNRNSWWRNDTFYCAAFPWGHAACHRLPASITGRANDSCCETTTNCGSHTMHCCGLGNSFN